MAKDTCSFSGCTFVVRSKRLCGSHYRQLRTIGRVTPLRPHRPRSADPVKWFLSWFDTSGGPDACHVWQRGYNESGYGQSTSAMFEIYGRRTTHQLRWILENGPVPQGMCVLHKCDNPPCGNPRHLFLGTQADNSADRVKKSRQAKGTKIGKSSLTEELVREIRRLHTQEGLGRDRISYRLGIHASAVEHVLRRRTWAWLE